MRAGLPRWTVAVTLVIGSGLALAPVAFQMFERAPLGGDMIDAFEPYMHPQKTANFRGYMNTIDAAIAEADGLRDEVVAQGALTGAEYDANYAGVTALTEEWEAIDTDMTDLLDRMDANMDNYRDMAALPPFWMFPWFFVIPGAIIAALSIAALIRGRDGRRPRALLIALLVTGLGVVAAPAIFQMFTRAPQGGQMVDEFRPMMTRARVQDVQGYFITLGSGEGQLRVGATQAFIDGGGNISDFPALQRFSSEWPTIVGEFNPMIATMSDNVDNYEAVDAMPPFPLFPWFFVIPGVLVATAAGLALRRPASTSLPPSSESETETA
jgi:hypothetical protein